MYPLPYSAFFLLATITLSYARHTYLHASSESDICMRPTCVIEASDILKSLDETVDPCDDFYRFACGGWIKRAEVTEEKPGVSATTEMGDIIIRKLKELLERKYKSTDPPFVKMLKDFYSTCIDLDGIEKKGSEPLKSMLSRLGGWPVVEGNEWDESTFDWLDTLISFRKLGYNQNILISLDFYPSYQNNQTVYIIHLDWPRTWSQNGSNKTLAKLFKMMVQAAKLLGAEETVAERELEDVLKFMVALGKISVVPESEAESNETSSEEEEQNLHTVKELQEELPQIAWLKYFNGILNDEVYENDDVYIGNRIHFITKLVDLLNSTDKRVIANYMMMRAVLESRIFLSKEWMQLIPEMRKVEEMNGEKTEARWKTCYSDLLYDMQMALTSYYVRYYFTEDSKDEAMILVKYIREEFIKLLEENDWMDEKTKKKAEDKANALKSYIGYPEELLNDTFVMKEYEGLTISTESHLQNMMSFRKRVTDKELSVFRKSTFETTPIRFKWILNVNAFYFPEENIISVPAGILHDVYYEKERPNYMNFGAIGYVIGHEITHGFDNAGRHFDKDGQRQNWWDEESDKNFRKKVQCIIDQYDNYTVGDGMKVNGEKTQNENIADNGGLKEAYRAYQSWTKDNGVEPLLPALKYTQNQLFWLSAAHVWCSKMDPKFLKKFILGAPHSPPRYRVIGPMSNLEEFSQDFKCSEDSPMNRKYKCQVW